MPNGEADRHLVTELGLQMKVCMNIAEWKHSLRETSRKISPKRQQLTQDMKDRAVRVVCLLYVFLPLILLHRTRYLRYT